MGKPCVLAEKPSVAMDISKIVNKSNVKHDGYIEGDKYWITWAVGHLVELCNPEEMDEKYAKWSFDTLPILPDRFKLKVNPKTSKQFSVVKKLLNSSDVSEIIVGTDPAREGEHIFRLIYLLTGCKKPFRRLWISSQTDKAIRDGFANLKPGSDYDNLYLSAKCRAESDWLVGMNGSRSFTLQCRSIISAQDSSSASKTGVLSLGRVQTPTLSMIVNRHHEIENFVPKDFWTIKSIYDTFSGTWFDPTSKESRIFDKAKADTIVNKITGKVAVVQDVKTENKKQYAPQLFDLTELQRTCVRKLGLSANDTLQTVQSLYEKKIVTYPRTDSKYISDDIVPTLMDRVKAVKYSPLEKVCDYILQMKNLKLDKKVVDNSKVSDHHAIIPTEVAADLNSLSDREKKVYDIIVRRFLAIFLPPYEYLSTTIITTYENESFATKGSTPIKKGWKVLYQNDESENESKDNKDGEDEEKQELPKCAIGDKFKINKAECKKDATKPPSLYNEATLLEAMEHAGKFVEDEELKEQLKEGGLGTPATRAAIIETLIARSYIVRKKKGKINYLIPTDKGIKLIEIVPKEIKSPELTAKWEKALNLMAKGQYPVQRFMESIHNYSKFLVEEAKKIKNVTFESSNSESGSKSNEVIGQCKECGADIIETAKGFSCSKWREGCKFTLWKNDKILGKYGKTLTKTAAKQLLKGDKASIKGCTDPMTKEKVDMEFFLIKEGVYWNIKDRIGGSNAPKSSSATETIHSDKKTYSCPACKEGILSYKYTEKFKGWGCNRWKEGCGFGIPAESGGVNLEPYIPQLQEKKETDVIVFKSPKGTYKAKLKVKAGKLDREFINDR